MKTFRKQMTMLPPSIDEYVPEDDLVRYVDTLAEELNEVAPSPATQLRRVETATGKLIAGERMHQDV